MNSYLVAKLYKSLFKSKLLLDFFILFVYLVHLS